MHRVDFIDERKRGPVMPPSYAPLVGPCTTGDLVQYMLTLKVWSELPIAAFHWPRAEMFMKLPRTWGTKVNVVQLA
jgi:hypothetical protein